MIARWLVVVVADVGVSEVGLDDSADHAHGDMGSDVLFGPVVHGAQLDEVLEDPEGGFDLQEAPVGAQDLGGRRLAATERRGEHVAAGEELSFAVEGGLVVVIQEAAFVDIEVEEAGDTAAGQDAPGGLADLGLVAHPAAAD